MAVCTSTSVIVHKRLKEARCLIAQRLSEHNAAWQSNGSHNTTRIRWTNQMFGGAKHPKPRNPGCPRLLRDAQGTQLGKDWRGNRHGWLSNQMPAETQPPSLTSSPPPPANTINTTNPTKNATHPTRGFQLRDFHFEVACSAVAQPTRMNAWESVCIRRLFLILAASFLQHPPISQNLLKPQPSQRLTQIESITPPQTRTRDRRTMASGADVCLVILAIFLPPIATLLKRGCGVDFLINILLTLLGHIPGVIHAIYLILHDRERRKDGKMLYPPPRHQHNNQAMYGQGPGYATKDMPPAQPVYREQPVNYNQDHVQPMPPTYGDYTERDIVGSGAAPVHNEKHEYATVAATAPPQQYQNYSTKEV